MKKSWKKLVCGLLCAAFAVGQPALAGQRRLV